MYKAILPDDAADLKRSVAELEAQAVKSETSNAEIALLERRHQKSMQAMSDVIDEPRLEMAWKEQGKAYTR